MLGVLEMAGKGSGFLRRRDAGYLPSNGDVHVGERLIRQLGLRPGDEIDGSVRTGGKGRGPSRKKSPPYWGEVRTLWASAPTSVACRQFIPTSGCGLRPMAEV